MIPYNTFREIPLWGSFSLKIFGVLVVAGFWLAVRRAHREAARVSLPRAHIEVMMLGCIVGALVGGHLGDVLNRPGHYLADPSHLWNLAEGQSSIGGAAGAIGLCWLYLRWRGMRAWAWADVAASASVLGYAVARIGCFLVHDHPGVPTSLPIGVRYPDGTRWDLGLMEALVGFGISAAIAWFRRRPRPVGQSAGLVMLLYGLCRLPLDFLRLHDTRYGGLTPAQYFAISFIFGGAAALWFRRSAPVDPLAFLYRSPAHEQRDQKWLARWKREPASGPGG